MSRRLQFYGEQISGVETELSEFVGDLFDTDNGRVSTFVKSTNESFYEIGMDTLYWETKSLIRSEEVIDRYFSNGEPCTAEVFKHKDITEYLQNHEVNVAMLMSLTNGGYKIHFTKQLIKFLTLLSEKEIDLVIA